MPTATRRSVGAQGHRTPELDNVLPFPARARSGGTRPNADNPVGVMDYVKSEPDAPAPGQTPGTLNLPSVASSSTATRRDGRPARGRTRGSDALPPVSTKPPRSKKSKRAPSLPTPRPTRCAPHAGCSVVDATHELARELCKVRWTLHCALGRYEKLEELRSVLSTQIAKLRARDAELVAQLADVAPNDLALADATTMHWRSSPLGRYAERDRSAEAGLFAQLEQLGVAVKGDGDR